MVWSYEVKRTRIRGKKGNGIGAPRKQKVRETKQKVAGLFVELRNDMQNVGALCDDMYDRKCWRKMGVCHSSP